MTDLPSDTPEGLVERAKAYVTLWSELSPGACRLVEALASALTASEKRYHAWKDEARRIEKAAYIETSALRAQLEKAVEGLSSAQAPKAPE